ncbi:MAG: hypothetical protein AAFZ49_00130 [Cyanobacteria bacterium J06659_2]
MSKLQQTILIAEQLAVWLAEKNPESTADEWLDAAWDVVITNDPHPKRLTISIDLAEDSDPQAIGEAIAMLVKQTANPEKTAQDLLAERDRVLAELEGSEA